MLLDLAHLSPIVLTTLMALIVLIIGVFTPKKSFKGWLGYLAVVSFALALGAVVWLWGQSPIELQTSYLSSALIVDDFGLALCGVILIGAILTTLSAIHYLPEQHSDHAEYYALVMFSVVGMMGLVLSRDLLSLFVSLEVMSIAVYVLAGFKRQSPYSIEAALKYFVLGSFASALLLMGIAYIWGVTGELDMVAIASKLASEPELMGSPLTSFALMMILGAFAFKIAAAPFHMWTPDVYEGAPSSVSGFMAVAVKTAAFGAFARVLLTAFGADELRTGFGGWEMMVAGLAVASMFVGNLMALAQTNLKRILGFSAIAHTGYLMIALLARPAAATGADGSISADWLGPGLVFYLLAYTLANAGAFAVAAAVSGKDTEDVGEPAYAGVAKRSPWLGLTLTVCILSLLGIPATAGFMGKFAVFTEALATPGAEGGLPWLWLIILAVVNSVISAYYYLRILVTAWMRPEVRELRVIESKPLRWAAGIAAIGTIVIGLLPGSSLEASGRAGASLAYSSGGKVEMPARKIADEAKAQPSEAPGQ